MISMLRTYAKYPFLPEARDFISKEGISVYEALSENLEDNRAIQDAWNRVFGAFLGKIAFIPSVDDKVWNIVVRLNTGEEIHPSEILDASDSMRDVYGESEEIDVPHGEEDLIARIISYPIARIMVSCLNDSRFIRRYALKEAELFRKLLEIEWNSGKEREFFIDVGKKLGLSVEISDDWAAMDVISYIKNTAQMKDPRKKLLFQDVRKGMVYFRKRTEGNEHMDVIFRSFQQALQEKILSELPLNVPDELCESISTIISILRLIISNYYENYRLGDLGEVEVEKFPPCMKRLYSMAKSGLNLPHSGRFALTAFLHHIGMSVDDIVKVFSASPDFNESITRYQVRHISGEISGVEYMPQRCSVMVSEGLCYNPDNLCRKEWMTHPLIYYRVKKEDRKHGKTGKNRDIRD